MVATRPQQIVPWIGVVLAVIALAIIRIYDAPSTSGAARRPSTRPQIAPSVATVPATTTTDPATVTARKRKALAGISFTDVTGTAGLVFAPSADPPSSDVAAGTTSGAAVADVNGDGRPDVMLTGIGRASALFLNEGDGRFKDVTASAGLPTGPSAGSTAATFADIDGDGDLDLLLLGFGSAPDQLFLNDGSAHFQPDASSGLDLLPYPRGSRIGSDITVPRLGATWADVDGNGTLDLLETNWDVYAVTAASQPGAAGASAEDASTCAYTRSIQAHQGARSTGLPPNRTRLYLNDGRGHLRDATSSMELHLTDTLAFTPVFTDLDGDGFPDLLLTGDTCTSRVLHNDRGRRFVDVTKQLGVGTDENGMGSVVRDLNGDGRPDWFVTAISYPTANGDCPVRVPLDGCSGNRLYLSRPDGTYEDVTTRAGVRDGGWGWGAAIEDFGNDGRLVLTMTNGYQLPAGSPAVRSGDMAYFGRFVADPMRFWVPDGPRYLDAAGAAGLTDTGIGHALVAFDYDGDGRMDLLVANSNSGPRLYRNTSPADRSWLTVRLEDPTHPGNRQAIGARVEVTREGGRPVVQWISTAGSYMAQKPPEVHVGFGSDFDPEVTVSITWPGSTRSQVVPHVGIDRIVTITRT